MRPNRNAHIIVINHYIRIARLGTRARARCGISSRIQAKRSTKRRKSRRGRTGRSWAGWTNRRRVGNPKWLLNQSTMRTLGRIRAFRLGPDTIHRTTRFRKPTRRSWHGRVHRLSAPDFLNRAEAGRVAPRKRSVGFARRHVWRGRFAGRPRTRRGHSQRLEPRPGRAERTCRRECIGRRRRRRRRTRPTLHAGKVKLV